MDPPNMILKAKYAFYSALVFFLIANPETYKATQLLLGRFFTISTNGCPSPTGLFFHALIFYVVLLGLMLFPRDR